MCHFSWNKVDVLSKSCGCIEQVPINGAIIILIRKHNGSGSRHIASAYKQSGILGNGRGVFNNYGPNGANGTTVAAHFTIISLFFVWVDYYFDNIILLLRNEKTWSYVVNDKNSFAHGLVVALGIQLGSHQGSLGIGMACLSSKFEKKWKYLQVNLLKKHVIS